MSRRWFIGAIIAAWAGCFWSTGKKLAVESQVPKKLIYNPQLTVNEVDEFEVICRRVVHAEGITPEFVNRAWVLPNGDLEVESFSMYDEPPEVPDEGDEEVMETKIVPANKWSVDQYDRAGKLMFVITSGMVLECVEMP